MASGSHAGRRKFETSTIKERAEEYFPEMVEIRRDIHRHPEIGRNEVRTSALIRKKLEEYGVDAIERPVPTAVVALIHGARGPGRCVALRCDIDALPVQEETGLNIRSPQLCGIKDWCENQCRFVVLLYKSTCFDGELHSSSEGRVWWEDIANLPNLKLSLDMRDMLRVFKEENLSEFFYYQESSAWKYVLK